ncbi:MAG: energy-coupling factor transporter ATPase [Microbacteriaceae bacterium]|nr:energy-coupling factor transporter ATPase [Microbacteriaceae bacterium]HPZ33931.1 energy-coupling factor transporter ATPase [Microbacteriaceae bacterium]
MTIESALRQPANDGDVAATLRVQQVGITHEGATRATPEAITFDVRRGEVVLLLGPSGSGKSTLALSLNGLIPHALPAELAGTVTVAGLDTADTTVAELSTHVSMVFQDPDSQIVTGTVLDEVAFGPENLRMPVEEVLARAEAGLRRVGLWEHRAANPDTLSGGGRQRLAIACALAIGAPILVLDEPTANLDPQGIDDVYEALSELVAAGDHSIVLIEHNLDAAIALVDRVVVIDRAGRLAFDGPVETVLRAHAEELVAMGVWLPTATLAALRLRTAGYALEPLPLTAAELRYALDAAPAPAALTGWMPAREDDAAAAASTPLIEVRGLSLQRGRTPVLAEIDLEVHAGEFLAVVGENGAGKTTLVQAIAGVIPPPKGRIRVGTLDPARSDVRALAAQIGFVFQNPEHQFITGTVFDELAHGLRVGRVHRDEIEQRVGDMLDRFGLADKADTHPFLLSGGEKRRLSVGTALIAGAPVLALDEPTFGQDRARADELLGLLKELNAAGTTVIVVTHDMQLVAEYATRTAVMRGGRLLAHAPTAEIFADPDWITQVGLQVPPLVTALRGTQGHPELRGLVRLSELPGTAA